jgi:hypothetical protein
MPSELSKARGREETSTERAILFVQGEEQHWIPRSLIEHTSRDLRSGEIVITLPEWKAEELNLETE